MAIDVPAGLKDAIERDVVTPLRGAIEGARWSRPEGRHLTLKFLGETEQVEAVSTTLERVAAKHRPFEARFTELGGFPSLKRPRVLWVGLGEGAEEAAALACDIATGLEPLGFEAEERPFHAHLTIGRFRRPRMIDELPTVTVPDERFGVAEITLFSSKLHPHGARYTQVMRAHLA